ncbi:MAG: outer membrane protein transport protein [bacterium]|jgi:long-chain fatty acid transport protein
MRIASIARLGMAAALIAVMCGAVFATNGYFPHGVGMRAKAVGGAGVAWPQDAMAGATNPAAAGFLGNHFDAGLDIFRPSRGSEIGGNDMGEDESADGMYDANGKSNFWIPEIGYSNQYRDHLAVGFALFSPGWMNTKYATPIPVLGVTNAGVDLMQLSLVPYVSYRVKENHWLGFGLNLAWQTFEATGLENLADTVWTSDTTYVGVHSSDPMSVTNNSHESSMGVGLSIGYMGRVHEMVDVGAVYHSRTYMGRFKKYAGLLAEMGDFDMPPSIAGGVTVRATEKATLAFDVQHIWYSDIKSVGNPLLPNLEEAQLGEDGGAGFGWEDVTAFKFGLAYDATEKVKLLGGFNYGKQPVPESETMLNMLSPGVVESHLTLGATIRTCTGIEVTLAYMHAFQTSVDGSGSIPEGDMEDGGFGGGESSINMSANSFGIAVGWGF